MKCTYLNWDAARGWNSPPDLTADARPPMSQLVLYFAARETLAANPVHTDLVARFPDARIVGCSTGGQIGRDDVTDAGVKAVAISFASTRIKVASNSVIACSDSFVCGAKLGLELASPDLAGVFVLSDALMVNGSRLAAGLSSAVGRGVAVSGGLAGDGAQFGETWVAADAIPAKGVIVAVGFYGEDIRFGHGSAGGWNVFGPRRRITRSIDNVLFELDGQPALDLYERYLGPEEAALLPGSALLFPLSIRDPDAPDRDVVRTVLAVDQQARTMTFAGDVPQGWSAQLMRGQFDQLSEASMQAARQASAAQTDAANGDCLAILVSCIGRRLLLGQRIADEVDAAVQGLASGTGLLGFYSYGEIAPHAVSGVPQLHNQTMTVTTIRERAA